jgi:hypothetical protein
MTLTLEQVGDHLLGTIMDEAPLDEITGQTKAFLAILDEDAVRVVHRFAKVLLAARQDEDVDVDPRSADDIARQDAMLAGIGMVRAITGPPACEHRCGNEMCELSPRSWEMINASRANPDADVDYGVILDLEILAHCGEQTREELDEIKHQVEKHFHDPRAAVAGIRSGAITLEKLNGWFALLPIAPPTQAMLEIREAMASLELQGKICQNGQMRWSVRPGEFRPVYRVKGS